MYDKGVIHYLALIVQKVHYKYMPTALKITLCQGSQGKHTKPNSISVGNLVKQ